MNSCSKSLEDNEQVHPQFNTSSSTNSLVKPDLKAGKIEKLANRFETLKLVQEIDKDIVLGRIVDAEFDENSDIYALDQNQVKVFKFSKSKVDTLGSKGRGPGEMLFPMGMEFDSLGHLYISDLRRGITDIQGQERNYLSTSSYSDLKISKDGIYLRKSMIISPNPNGDINTIDFLGTESDSILYGFGNAYISNNRLAVRNYSSGLIEYVPHNDLLLSINDHSPYLYAYRSGKVVWTRKINDFKSFEMISTNEPLAIKYHEKFTENNLEYDHLKTIEVIEDEYILLQILRTNSDKQKESISKFKLRSFILNSNSGYAYQINDLPKIMAINDNDIIALEKTKNSLLKHYTF